MLNIFYELILIYVYHVSSYVRKYIMRVNHACFELSLSGAAMHYHALP